MTAGPITLRLVYTLVLIAIVPAVSFVATILVGQFTTLAIDEEQLYYGLFAGLWVVLLLLFWRTLIVWAFGRKLLNALLICVPFAQVIYPHPLWTSSGCMGGIQDSILRSGQHAAGIGLYTWIAVWLWWGGERFMMNKTRTEARPAMRVSNNTRRLAMAIGSIPIVVGCYVIIACLLDEFGDFSAPMEIALAYWLTTVIASAIWIMIWRSGVSWTPPAIWKTAASIVLLLALPGAGPLLSVSGWLNNILTATPIICWGLWMALTVSYWPMRSDDHAPQWLQPRCRNCCYLLSGLQSTRCPELGDHPTLDQLWMATAGEVV